MILLLSGYKRSGKDTAAEFIVREMGFQKMALADTLKEEVSRQYGIPLNYFYDQALKEEPLLDFPLKVNDSSSLAIVNIFKNELKSDKKNLHWTPRALLILEGSTKRAVNPNYWSENIINKINNLENKNVIITDVRYRSEISALKDYAGALGLTVKTVRIDRFDTCDTNDPSERDLDGYNFDVVIPNRGTLEQFMRNIKEKLTYSHD
jgi:hypothetical protein